MDAIRETIIARAETLGLTAYAITRECKTRHGEQSPSDDAVKRYLSGKCSLNSRYVSQICDVLNLELRPTKKAKRQKLTAAGLMKLNPKTMVAETSGALFSVAELTAVLVQMISIGENADEFAARFRVLK